MASTLVDALFFISLVLPPAVVAMGLIVLAWPGRQAARSTATAKPALVH